MCFLSFFSLSQIDCTISSRPIILLKKVLSGVMEIDASPRLRASSRKRKVMHCCRKPTLSTISQKQSRKTMVKLSSITSLIRTKQSSMKMFSIWYKLNYSDALKCAEVSEIAVHSAQNWPAEIAVHFMGIKSTTPKKSIVRMYGIAIAATRAATTAPRQFLPGMIW